MARAVPAVEAELEERISRLGFDLVESVWAGSGARPILRIRIDVPEGRGEDASVSVKDCADVSRALETWLDALPAMPERYVLEVSSPGLERPLTRPRDWTRFTGREVALRGKQVLAGRAKRLEGELLGLVEDERGRHSVRLRLPGGDELEIPLGEIEGANVVFRWK